MWVTFVSLKNCMTKGVVRKLCHGMFKNFMKIPKNKKRSIKPKNIFVHKIIFYDMTQLTQHTDF
jgi:hypothetical protein